MTALMRFFELATVFGASDHHSKVKGRPDDDHAGCQGLRC